MKTSHTIPIWRPWCTLTILAEQSYYNHAIVCVSHLWTSICLGWWEMYCVGNIFLGTVPALKLWNCGSPLLLQVFISMKWEIFLITGENGVDWLMSCISETALSNSIIALFVTAVLSLESNRRHCLQSNLHTLQDLIALLTATLQTTLVGLQHSETLLKSWQSYSPTAFLTEADSKIL